MGFSWYSHIIRCCCCGCCCWCCCRDCCCDCCCYCCYYCCWYYDFCYCRCGGWLHVREAGDSCAFGYFSRRLNSVRSVHNRITRGYGISDMERRLKLNDKTKSKQRRLSKNGWWGQSVISNEQCKRDLCVVYSLGDLSQRNGVEYYYWYWTYS